MTVYRSANVVSLIMRILRRVDEDDVVLSFAEAEFTSPQHREEVAAWVDEQARRKRLLSTPPEMWNSFDRRVARSAVVKYRGPILRELLELLPRWFEITMTTKEIPSLRTITFPPLEALARDRRLGTLVAALDAGRETPNDGFSAGYRSLRQSFDVTRMRGLPSVTALTEAGPYVVFEGLTRLSVLHSMKTEGMQILEPLNLFLGVTDQLQGWRFYGSP